MNKQLNSKEFSEVICQQVKEALPQELEEAEVRTACLDMYADGTRTALLIIRPWINFTTGFCLDRYYKQYVAGIITPEHAVSEIIHDRRVYCMSANNGMDVSVMQDAAIIYA